MFDRLYDRQGNKLTWDRYVKLRYEDPEYFRIAQDHVGAYEVSTVWLGMDHNFGRAGPPIIFETMVFLNTETSEMLGQDMGCWRYSTEEEAREGHAATILSIEATAGADVVDEADAAQEEAHDE